MSLRVLGHPVHTALVHFPIGLCCTTVVWDAAWLGSGDGIWWRVAYYTLAAGLVSSVPAAFTGFADYIALREDHPAVTTATRHLLATGSGMGFFLISLLLRADGGSPEEAISWLAPALALVGAGLFGIGGWLGGELVLRHGVGRADGTAGETGATREKEDRAE